MSLIVPLEEQLMGWDEGSQVAYRVTFATIMEDLRRMGVTAPDIQWEALEAACSTNEGMRHRLIPLPPPGLLLPPPSSKPP